MSTSANVPTMLPPVHGNVYPPQQAFNDNALLQQLKNQIEFYFCPQNLANDPYLLSHLHATEHIGAVPIQVLCQFPKVRQLYCLARFGQHVPVELASAADPLFVSVALRGSSVVNVSDDGMWVMPHVIPEPQPWVPNDGDCGKEAGSTVVTTATDATAPPSPSSQTTGSSSVGVPTHPLPLKERNIVMLRDIPASASEETIMKVFSSEHGTPKSARPDIGNTWYVTFESEEQALAALAATREKTIDGAPICGHLKSELSANKEQRPMPPPMPPLPPAAQQDRMPARAPSHHPTQAPYYSMQQPVMAQQPYGYGYVPYGYAVQQPHYGYPVQQRYQYGGGYVRPQQQHQPQHSGIRPDNPSAPPSNVFVRPHQNHNGHTHHEHNRNNNNNHNNNGNNNGKKKRNSRNKNRNNKNQKKNNGEAPSPDNPVDNRQQPQLDQDQSHIGGDVHGQLQKAPSTDSKKQWRNHRGKKNTKKQEDKLDMGVEQFPALGGCGSTNSPRPKSSQPNKPAYAEALLKRKTPQPPSKQPSSDGPIDAGLAAAMNGLAFTEAGAASYDEW